MNSAAAAKTRRTRFRLGCHARYCARRRSAPCSGSARLLLALFVTWVATAQAIYIAAFGYEAAASIPDFATRMLTTPQGWWLIIVGMRRRLPVCAGGAVRQRGFVPADARPSRRRRRSHGDIAARGSEEPGADGGMGLDRCAAAGRGIAAVLPRACDRHPAARPRHLASLSQGDRAGSQPAAAAAPSAARTASAADFPANLFPWRRKDDARAN